MSRSDAENGVVRTTSRLYRHSVSHAERSYSPHLVDSLTLDDLPASFPHFDPDPEQLCEYCEVLLQLLTEQAQGSKMEQPLTGLLCELVWFFAAKLKAPRWLRTADGVAFIEDLIQP